MLIFTVFSLLGLKAYQQISQQGSPTTLADAQNSSNAASNKAGVAPMNGMPADPTPSGGISNIFASDYLPDDDNTDDDGAMSRTAKAAQFYVDGDPVILAGQNYFDGFTTQLDSGQDTVKSQRYRPEGYNRNSTSAPMDDIWDDACDAEYISAQPGIQYRFNAPGMQRQDNNPNLNNQPWAQNTSFMNYADPTNRMEYTPNDDYDDEEYL